MTLAELEEMKKVNPWEIDPEELIDINDVVIRTDLPREERIADFIQQIKNPYLFRCGDLVVKVEFTGEEITLSDRIQQYMRLM